MDMGVGVQACVGKKGKGSVVEVVCVRLAEWQGRLMFACG